MISPYATLLTALRTSLEQQNLDGLLVLMNDPFQNEVVPDHFNRIHFLTGFTGSSGFLLVTLKKAVFVTDGRYTIQARQELDLDLFDVLEGGLGALESLIAPYMRIGCDAWTMTYAIYQNLKRLPVSWILSVDNSVDFLWKERPSLPSTPIQIHEDCFAGTPSASKRESIAKILKNQGIQAFFLTTGDSICWLLNIRGNDIKDTPIPLSYAFLKEDASVDFFVDKEKISSSVQDFLGHDVRIHPIDTLKTFLPTVSKVGLDPKTTPTAITELLALDTWKPMENPCLLPKSCKNNTEQQGAINCHKIDGQAVTKFLHWVSQQETLNELDAAKKLASLRSNGLHYKGSSFETISAVGPNGALCHYRPTPLASRSFQKGDIYLVDSGGQYLNGTTDVTRTVIWQGSPTSQQKLHYTLVLKGHIALATARFPKGTTGVQLDILARQFLWIHGLDYSHGTGHGVGSYLSVHESPPSISPRAKNTPLQVGMIVSNEPGYYLEGHYGIRLENMMLVKESKDFLGFLEFETLTLVPFDNRLIDFGLLSPEEKSWLKNYHQKIFDTFEEHLAKEELVFF